MSRQVLIESSPTVPEVVPGFLSSTNTADACGPLSHFRLFKLARSAGMGGRRRSSSPDGAQALITDFFHQLREEEELSSEWVVHQTLITDFYHEREETVEVSQSVFQPSFSDSEFHSLLDEEPQIPISQYSLTYSEYTHVSETPEIRLARAKFDIESEVESQMRKCLW